MAFTRQEQDRTGIAPETALAGILALLVEEREQRVGEHKDAAKIEILLSDAGLSNEDIATVTGKRPDTVRVALTRARQKAT